MRFPFFATANSIPVDHHESTFQPISVPVQPVKIAVAPWETAGQNSKRDTLHQLKRGIPQLFLVLLTLGMLLLRLVRLVIAAAFSLVAIVGTGFHFVSQVVVHPDDRRLLPRVKS